jgi:hypothetical protein
LGAGILLESILGRTGYANGTIPDKQDTRRTSEVVVSPANGAQRLRRFLAQQQGTKLDTSYKKKRGAYRQPRPLVAEIIRQQCFQGSGDGGSLALADGPSIKIIQ